MNRKIKTIGAFAVLALALAACGSKNDSGSSTSSAGSTPAAASSAPATGDAGSGAPTGGKFKACMVLDTGGVDDHSFNEGSWAGMTAAQQKNPNIEISHVDSQSQNDYVPNLTQESNAGCQAIVAVGGLMGDALKEVAGKNPTKSYAEVDNASVADNVYGLQYNTAQPAFQAGYLAAGLSKSGAVATYGGLPIAPVTIYMDGFWEGVQYYNQQKSKNVKVLGWDEGKQNGTFANSFTDTNKGKTLTQQFQSQGADIVFPVAGGTGVGSLTAAKQSNGKMNVIWVDSDGCLAQANYCSVIVTSVMKNLSGGVEQYITSASQGNFLTGSYIGDLTNDGASLSPYHDWDSKVPADLKAEVAALKDKITSGEITIKSKAQPTK